MTVNCLDCWFCVEVFPDEFEVCTKGNTERLLYHQFCEEYEKI